MCTSECKYHHATSPHQGKNTTTKEKKTNGVRGDKGACLFSDSCDSNLQLVTAIALNHAIP
jgi:hypothetical protein